MSIRKTKTTIETIADLEKTIDEIARLEVSQRAKEARRDKAIQLVRDEYDTPVEELKKRIKALTKLAETYCLARRTDVFTGKSKSASSALAKFGFRDGQPTLRLINRKWTWESVLTALKGADLFKFVRTKEEVDKDNLKSAKLTDAEYAAIGLRLDSVERFYIDSKAEDSSRINSDSETQEA